MSHPEPTPVVPLLLDGARGRLQALYYAPAGPVHPVGDILVLPPFGEEMNRCRAMVAMQARALSGIGMGTLVVDPYGTGDSAGEFAEATWDGWLADMRLALRWLRANGPGCNSLWALRLGAVMASQLAREDGLIEHLLLWQPVLDGKQFWTQFLRIRIAAELNLPDRVKTTGELRQRSGAGEAIEVSGYRVGPQLAQQVDQLAFDGAGLPVKLQIDWFEVLPSEDVGIAPAAMQGATRLREGGAQLTQAGVVGPAFWHVHERELAPALVAACTARLRTWRPVAGTTLAARSLQAFELGNAAEQPLFFPCGNERLAGVLHRAADDARRGVIIVVAGGPQYRAGAHRQFVSLARRLVRAGIPVLRFDLRGMGDSSGEHVGYQHSDPDIRAAVDAMLKAQPQLTEVVLLGECESASGILFYAWRDVRVSGAVLINPWVRTEEGRAQVIVRHYYLGRLLSADFWKLVLSGRYDARASLSSMVDVIRAFVRGRIDMARQRAKPELDDISGLPLPVRVAEGLRRFRGRSLLLMSGFDLIAREFDEVTSASKAWQGLLDSERVQRVDVTGADHTFSREVWKHAAAEAVTRWLGPA